jgi:hypothetical protein
MTYYKNYYLYLNTSFNTLNPCLQDRAINSDFNNNERIQNSITLAWNKTTKYYRETDVSIVWITAVVLHPWFKSGYFEKSSKLVVEMLKYQECLSNWHQGGAIQLDRAWNAVELNWIFSDLYLQLISDW